MLTLILYALASMFIARLTLIIAKFGFKNVATTYTKASLVITIILAFFFVNEPITPKVFLGAGLITASNLVLGFK